MERKVEVILEKYNLADGILRNDLLFNVYGIDKIGDEIFLGHFLVDSNGVLNIELDNYLTLYRKDIIDFAKQSLFESGLKNILLE